MLSVRSRTRMAAVGVILLLAGSEQLRAQPAPSAEPSGSDAPQVFRTTGARIAFGRNIQIARDEEVLDAVVVIGGSVRIEGRVQDGVVVVGGNVELGPQADVRGDVVLVGGRLLREPGARLRGSVSDVSFGDWTHWRLGGLSVPIVDFGDLGRWLSLLGAVFRIALLAIVMACIVLVARAPVARVGRTAASEPVRSFVIGLIAEIFFVPALVVASIGLIVTIIGIPLVALLVPLAFFVAFVALMLGFTGLACQIGQWVEDRLGWRTSSALVATMIGLVLVAGPTMLSRLMSIGPDPLRLPAFTVLFAGIIVEYVVWTIGLGAALMTGFGRWSTAPPPVPPVEQHGILPVTS